MAEQNIDIEKLTIRYFKTEAMRRSHKSEIGDNDLVFTGETIGESAEVEGAKRGTMVKLVRY